MVDSRAVTLLYRPTLCRLPREFLRAWHGLDTGSVGRTLLGPEA